MKTKGLAQRIGLAFAIIGCVFVTTVVLTLVQVATLKETQNGLLNIRTPASLASLKLMNGLTTNHALMQVEMQSPQTLSIIESIWETQIDPQLNKLLILGHQPQLNFEKKHILNLHKQLQHLRQKQLRYLNDKQGNLDAIGMANNQIKKLLNGLIQRQETLVNLELSSAHQQTEMLSLVNWILLLIGLTLCGLYTLVLTRFISTPIQTMVQLAEAIAKGDLKQNVLLTGATELDQLNVALTEMVKRLNSITDVAQSMSHGDYSKRLVIKSDADTLGKAVNKMLADFDKIVSHANSIANGNYECHIPPRSIYDKLTNALGNMTAQLHENKKALLQQQTALELSNRKLSEASQYKSSFLSNMSHEFRTPLNSLLLLAKFLKENKEGNLSEQQIEHASIIERSGRELLDLINDILDLAKVEAGKLNFAKDDVLLQPFIKELYDEFRLLTNNKSLRFDIQQPKHLPESIYTDRQRLKQICRNLLSNAIKFTNQGSVTLKMYTTEENVICFQVTDTGCGIGTNDIKLIFEAFEQGHSTLTNAGQGTGLGLSISLHLAKLLGGDLIASSINGSGSQFSLLLPLSLTTKTCPPQILAIKEAHYEQQY